MMKRPQTPDHVDSRERHERYTCTVEVILSETDDDCDATVRLAAPRGSFVADGHAHRHPDDPTVPLIGEELAIGRALIALGEQLLTAANNAIEDHESRPIHLVDVP